jgi:hypothetical protein
MADGAENAKTNGLLLTRRSAAFSLHLATLSQWPIGDPDERQIYFGCGLDSWLVSSVAHSPFSCNFILAVYPAIHLQDDILRLIFSRLSPTLGLERLMYYDPMRCGCDIRPGERRIWSAILSMPGSRCTPS